MMRQRNSILVLGASSDIGREILRSIDDGETQLIAHCHSGRDKLLELQLQLNSELIIVVADLSTETGVQHLIDEVSATCGSPDKIIHLPASKFGFVRFKDQPWNAFQAEIDLQLKSIVRILQEYLPKMAAKRHGRVVLMLSSVCIGIPPKALSMYTVTKYALLGLMKSLASEYSDKGITVNALSPSMVETAFLSEIPEKMVDIAAASQPLKRNATAHEIASLVRFVLSDDAGYMSGVNVPITGGSNF